MKPYTLSAIVPSALAAQERGQGAVVVTVVANRTDSGPPPGSRLLILEDGCRTGSFDSHMDAVLARDAMVTLGQGRSRIQSYWWVDELVACGNKEEGHLDVFYEVLPRRPRLIIVGAGHIAIPLARAAKLLEFDVFVVDDRPEFASVERFPDADRLVVGPYRASLASLPLDRDSFVVLVTRGHVHDEACLEETLLHDLPYIGMIGSKRRVRTVMERLKEKGTDPSRLREVRAPVGLDIGAETPVEIAISILAEIINLRRNGRAPSMALGDRLRV